MTYQYLLIKKAAGSRLQTIADCLNHSKLKKRLAMMKNQKKNGSTPAASLIIPALAAGGLLLSSNALASMPGPARSADILFHDRMQAESGYNISEISAAPKTISITNPDAVSKSQEAEPERTVAPLASATQKKTEASSDRHSHPAIMIDGELMPESFNLADINPEDIGSITIIKDRKEEYPDGLMMITMKKSSGDVSKNANAAASSKVVGYGNIKKDNRNGDAGDEIPNVYIVTEVNNIKGTNVIVNIVPGNDKEVAIESVQLKINGKTYDPDSVSSSFSQSNGESTQTVTASLIKSLHKFDKNKDTIILHTSEGTVEIPMHPL